MSDCARTYVVTKGVMHSAMSNRPRASPQRLGGSNIMQGRMFNGLCLLLFLFPSFRIFSSAPQQKRDRLDRYRQASMTVHKTQVNMSERRELSKRVKSVDPNNKPHPLKKCRAFRKKSLEDRQQFIKEQLVCFRCCSSIDHMAKNCKAEIQCMECGSDHHVSALHPGPAPWKKTAFPVSEDGREESDPTTQEVTSKCTEVCGAGMSYRACSKISLVNVYPVGHKKECKRMYVILDEQSNHSVVRTEFFDKFQIEGSSFPYSLNTCAGLKETAGRRTSGYIVESLDNNVSLHLPTLLECNQIPNIRSKIPTPDAARHFSHLMGIADENQPLTQMLTFSFYLAGTSLGSTRFASKLMVRTMLHLLKS